MKLENPVMCRVSFQCDEDCITDLWYNYGDAYEKSLGKKLLNQVLKYPQNKVIQRIKFLLE